MVSKPKQINGINKQNKAWSVGYDMASESHGIVGAEYDDALIPNADAATLFHNMDKAAINGVSYSCSHFFAYGLKHRADAVKLMEAVNG